jgi:hypothetical protein
MASWSEVTFKAVVTEPSNPIAAGRIRYKRIQHMRAAP